jgi:hypothetical protein
MGAARARASARVVHIQDFSFRVFNLEINLLGGVTFFLILGMLIGWHA